MSEPVYDDQIKNLEESPGSPHPKNSEPKTTGEGGEQGASKADNAKKLEANEGSAADDGVNYTGPQGGTPAKVTVNKGWWNKKRAGIAGGAAGLGVGTGIFASVFVAGPAQFLQLSSILQSPMHKSSSDAGNRMNRQYRYYKTGDIGETRVGLVGSKIFASTMAKLNDMGIEISRGATGAPTRTDFDISKLQKQYPQLEGMNDAEVKSFLADKLSSGDKLSINPDQIKGSGKGFYIDQGKFSLADTRLITHSTLSFLEDGKIVTGVNFRIFTKFFNVPSLFHPLDRQIAAAENKYLNNPANKGKAPPEEAEQVGELLDEEFNNLTEPINTTADPAVSDIEEEAGVAGKVQGVLIGTALVCEVRKVSTDIADVNYARIAIPSALEALNLIAIGEQIKAGGSDVSLEQLGAVEKSFTGADGTSIWSGMPLEELATGSHHTGSPATDDISADFKGAFYGSTPRAIKAGVSDAIGGEQAASVACSTGGQITQAFAGIALLFADIPTEGALTPIILARVATAGKGLVTSVVALHFIEGFIMNKATKAKLTRLAFSGAAGGALLAFGARQAANMNSISSGGISLGNNGSTLAEADTQRANLQEFQSQSLFARMFDVYDSRSLLGHFMDDISPSFGQNMVNFASGFTNFGSMFSSALTGFLPHASAASTTYDWGGPQFGIPDSMLNDSDLADPYINADNVAKLLDSSCLDSSGNLDTSQSSCPASRIDTCFGNQVTHDGGVWGFSRVHDVNVNTDEYTDANCADIGNTSDTNPASATRQWRRTIMAVFDTHVVCAAAQYQGITDSCDSTTAQTVAAQLPDTATTCGDAKACAQKVLSNKNIVFAYDSDRQNMLDTVAGKPISCTDDYGTWTLTSDIPADLSNLMLNVAAKYQIRITAMFSAHGGHNTSDPPNNGCHDGGRHPMGRAIDIGSVDGHLISPDSYHTDSYIRTFATYVQSVQPKGQFINGQPVGMGGMGQKQCFSPQITALPGINYFEDVCSHLHVDVGVAKAASTQ